MDKETNVTFKPWPWEIHYCTDENYVNVYRTRCTNRIRSVSGAAGQPCPLVSLLRARFALWRVAGSEPS